jgi:hypothetical protein
MKCGFIYIDRFVGCIVYSTFKMSDGPPVIRMIEEVSRGYVYWTTHWTYLL